MREIFCLLWFNSRTSEHKAQFDPAAANAVDCIRTYISESILPFPTVLSLSWPLHDNKLFSEQPHLLVHYWSRRGTVPANMQPNTYLFPSDLPSESGCASKNKLKTAKWLLFLDKQHYSISFPVIPSDPQQLLHYGNGKSSLVTKRENGPDAISSFVILPTGIMPPVLLSVCLSLWEFWRFCLYSFFCQKYCWWLGAFITW